MSDELTKTEREICRGLGLTEAAYLKRKAQVAERRATASPEELRAGRLEVLRKLQQQPCTKREQEAIAARILLIEEEAEQ